MWSRGYEQTDADGGGGPDDASGDSGAEVMQASEAVSMMAQATTVAMLITEVLMKEDTARESSCTPSR